MQFGIVQKLQSFLCVCKAENCVTDTNGEKKTLWIVIFSGFYVYFKSCVHSSSCYCLCYHSGVRECTTYTFLVTE